MNLSAYYVEYRSLPSNIYMYVVPLDCLENVICLHASFIVVSKVRNIFDKILGAVRSKAVILLLLIYCLMYFPSFVGVLCLYLICYAVLCVHSSFATILKMYCYYKCSVAFPRGAVGRSAV